MKPSEETSSCPHTPCPIRAPGSSSQREVQRVVLLGWGLRDLCDSPLRPRDYPCRGNVHVFLGTQRHGYCDNRVCACLLGFSVAYDCIRAGHFGSWTDCLLPNMSRCSWEYCPASPVTPGTGFLPRSNTQRTVTPDGVSGPLAATILTMMTGPVSGGQQAK